MLPQKLPKIKGWDLAASWSGAKGVSGDFYDCFPVSAGPGKPKGRWGIVIADVAGKGVPAAVFMAFCRTLTRTFCMDGRSPKEAIQRVNDLIIADSNAEWFVTMFYGLLDPKQNTLTYVNAGHPQPLWWRRLKKQVRKLAADGMALGVFPGIKLEEKTVTLERGDLVLHYTDGMTETFNARSDPFGERRIRAALKKSASRPPDEILEKLQANIATFSRGKAPSDDLTAILLKRNL